MFKDVVIEQNLEKLEKIFLKNETGVKFNLSGKLINFSTGTEDGTTKEKVQCYYTLIFNDHSALAAKFREIENYIYKEGNTAGFTHLKVNFETIIADLGDVTHFIREEVQTDHGLVKSTRPDTITLTYFVKHYTIPEKGAFTPIKRIDQSRFSENIDVLSKAAKDFYTGYNEAKISDESKEALDIFENDTIAF